MSLNNIRRATAEADTARWYVPNWNGDLAPWVEVRQAAAANRAFMSARLAWEQTSEGIRWSKSKAVAAKLDAVREVDYGVYAKTIVVAWGGLDDDDGKPFAGPPEELLRALGHSNFDDMRRFCQDPSNFSKGDPKELAGN